jgi:RNA-binding protein
METLSFVQEAPASAGMKRMRYRTENHLEKEDHCTMLPQLTGQQKKHLRGLAHSLKPVVLVGQKGLTEDVLAAIDAALAAHELIKLKFIEIKEKDQKQTLAAAIARETNCHLAGIIGHTAIFYRPAAKPSRRKITLP